MVVVVDGCCCCELSFNAREPDPNQQPQTHPHLHGAQVESCTDLEATSLNLISTAEAGKGEAVKPAAVRQRENSVRRHVAKERRAEAHASRTATVVAGQARQEALIQASRYIQATPRVGVFHPGTSVVAYFTAR